MNIDPKLRKIYDWSHKFPQFEKCGEMFDGTVENVFCITEHLAKSINWNQMQKVYLKDKESYDKMLKFKDGE
jgi:hypothetical protein